MVPKNDFAFCLNFPVWMVSMRGRTLSFSQTISYLRAALCWEGCSLLSWLALHCWMLLLETHTHVANTEGPWTPNITFFFHPATAELIDWFTNTVHRCLCSLRRVFHSQLFRDAFVLRYVTNSYNLTILHNHKKIPITGV